VPFFPTGAHLVGVGAREWSDNASVTDHLFDGFADNASARESNASVAGERTVTGNTFNFSGFAHHQPP